MSDLIDKREAISKISDLLMLQLKGERLPTWNEIYTALNELPTTEIIRCCDCKWWDRLEDGHPYGYCRACQSGTHTNRWDISIYRTCKFDFWCADAEPREEEEEEEEDE